MYLLFIIAFLVRLINLNQSLWLDEAVVAKVVKSIPFFQIPIQFSPGDFHPPLYYLFISLWTQVFGLSEIALRMPSIILSLVAGLFVYKIGCVLKDKQTGFWAAAFFLFNPLIIYYSQEARMYMMATAFLSIALYYFIRISMHVILAKAGIHKNRENHIDSVSLHGMTRDIVFFNIFCVLAMFTFYGSIFFIASMILVFGFRKYNLSKGKLSEWIPAFTGMTIGLVVSTLILFPLLIQQLHTAKTGLLEVKNWSLVLGKAELKNVFMIFVKFTSGRLSWFPKWSYYLVAGGWGLVVGAIILLGMKKNKLLAYLFILPLFIGLFVSFWAPMMMYFRYLYLIPVMCLLIAIGISKKETIKMGIVAVFIIFSLVYLFMPQFHREDWKKMASDLSPTQPVYMILPSSDPVSYYNSNVSLFEMRNMQKQTLPEFIQVVPYVEDIYGFDHTSVLIQKGCVLEMKSTYRGPLFLERWKCLRNA